MRSRLLVGLLLFSVSQLVAQVPAEVATLEGYVTRVGGPQDFDVRGVHITLARNVRFVEKDVDTHVTKDHLKPVYVGQYMSVWTEDRNWNKTRSAEATRIEQWKVVPATVSGTAIIDYVPAKAAGGDPTVRADGYLLRFTKDSAVTFTTPLTSLDQLTTNLWIQYRGVQQTDGMVIVKAAEIWPNVISKSEEKLRANREFDPGSVTDEDAQGGLSKEFLGIDVRRLPAHQDDALQSRVERIGQSLIPAYQKALPVSDPTRIHFRFQVVESKEFRDAIAFANGIILVPFPAISRLQNDSQIAAVLADNIAASLEKQEVLSQHAAHEILAANIAGAAGGAIVPGLGLVTGATTYGTAKHMITMHRRQSGRVALCLMHDGGYDLGQAPVAWWLLEPKDPKPVEKTNIPERAAYLYYELGATWQPALAAAVTP